MQTSCEYFADLELSENFQANLIENCTVTELENDLNRFLEEALQHYDHDYDFDPNSILFSSVNDHTYQKAFDHEEILEIVPPKQDKDSVPKTIQNKDHDYQVNWTDYVNEKLICRLCAKNPYEHDANYEVDKVLKKLKVLISRKTLIDFEYVAEKICRDCLKCLDRFYYFILKIKEAKKYFDEEKVCQLCFKELPKNYDVIMEHIITNHKNTFLEIVPCVFCVTNLSTIDRLKSHLRKQHSIYNIKVNGNTNNQNLSNEQENNSKDVELKNSSITLMNLKTLKSYQELKNLNKCSECPQKFTNEDNLRVHLLRNHAIQLSRIECSLCVRSFSHRSELFLHLNDHENELQKYNIAPIFTCTYCTEVFETDIQFFVHFKNFHNNSKNNTVKTEAVDIVYRCEFCDALFSNTNSMINHKNNHFLQKYDDYDFFQCIYCNTQFSDFDSFNKHKLAHKDEYKWSQEFLKSIYYLCDICFKTYSKLKYLNLHRKIQHTVEPKGHFLCHICCLQLYSKSDLDQHIITHTSNDRKQCKLCFKEFKIQDFQLHQVKFSDMSKAIDCDFCDKKLLSKCAYHKHLLNHEKNMLKNLRHFQRSRDERKVCREMFQKKKTIVCKICERSFFTENQLKIHQSRQHS